MRRTLVTAASVAAAASLSLAFANGCGAELDPAWDVKSFRVFGARITNATRATRMPSPVARAAEVAPGETARLSLAFLDPSPTPRRLDVVWIICPQLGRVGNSFGCTGTPFIGMGPEVDYTVPTDIRFGVDPLGRARIQALVYACSGGVAGVDPTTRQPTCTGDGAKEITMTRSIVVRTSEMVDINRNPELTGAEILLDSNGQTRRTLAADGSTRVPRCTTDPCPNHLIELSVSADSRETYATVDTRNNRVMQPERLQFGFYMSPPPGAPNAQGPQRARGEFDGTFFVDTAERPMGPVRQTWRAPTTPGVVTFVFNVSDVRGGFDVMRRTVTVE